MAVNSEKLAIESHENVQSLAYWVCQNDQYLDVFGTQKRNYYSNDIPELWL